LNKKFKIYLFLLIASSVITWILISFGAFVRLNGAGLACPDWPLCYGEVVPDPVYEIWLEVGHRYLAGVLMILIFIFMYMSFMYKDIRRYRTISIWAFSIVLVQAVFGGLTVLLRLHPYSVTFHLIFGNFLFFLVVLQTLVSAEPGNYPFFPRRIKVLAPMIVFFIILISGGANSSTYSGYACQAFPLCNPGDPLSFHLQNGAVSSENIPAEAGHIIERMGKSELIHLLHRLVAILGGIYLFIFALSKAKKRAGYYFLNFLIIAEIAVGIINALYSVPIPISVLHSLIAASITGMLAWDYFVNLKNE